MEWSRNANIYEVNLRQYTQEGRINSFAAHLPRLEKMGVDILSIMPVQPIDRRQAATLPGMPLIYGGQESGLDKRLAFFEKDPVQWKQYGNTPFYTMLLKLKKDNPALWNGRYGGDVQVRDVGNDKVLALRRQRGTNTVDVAVNLSSDKQSYSLPGARAARTLAAWDWRITTRPATAP